MADNAVIGALRVVLGADTAAFETGLKGAEKSLAKFQANIAKVGVAIGAGVAAAAVGLAVGIKKAIDEADKLGKLSQSIGIPVEQLSALKLAADLSGVSIEEVGKSVGRLSRSMSEIAGGATNTATNAFRALGISVKNTDGSLKSSTQVMEEVADKFAKMEDGAGKTALAITIFGRSGANLIPLLNAGAKGLRETREEAEALGLVIDGRTAKAAEAFNDNLTRLSRVVTGIALNVAALLGPRLQFLSEQFVKSSQSMGIAQTAAEKIVYWFDRIVLSAQAVPVVFTTIGKVFAEFAVLVGSALTGRIGQAKAALDRLNAAGAEADAQFARNRQSLQDVSDQGRMLADHFGNLATQAGKTAAPIIASKNALDEFIKSQQKQLASQQAEAMAVGLSAGARERLRVVMQAETIARENNLRLTAAQQIAITTLANAMQQAVLQQQGLNLLLEAAEPHEKFRLEMAQNAAALAAVGATAEQIARVNLVTAQKFGATWTQVTGEAIGGFAAFANEMGKSNAKIATVGKALAIVEATINTYVAFTKALAATPPPLNYIAAAGVLAAGLAKVAAIKSQAIPKMATGGSFVVPGGVSGVDNRFVPLNLASGERVTVEPAGAVASGQSGGVRRDVQEITLRMPSGLMREFWASGIEQINSLTADGYRLKVAPV